MAKFGADDLIYNRFDLIYVDNVEQIKYEYADEVYIFQVHVECETAVINVWGKEYPQDVFDAVIRDVFIKYPEVLKIQITRAYNNYKKVLYETNDILLELPESFDNLLSRIKSKHRYNLRRSKLLIEQKWGNVSVEKYISKEVPDIYIKTFFDWKRRTHAINYNMTEREYLNTYHVTDCLIVKAGERLISILFYCRVHNTVYLENLSYDRDARSYSPGLLGYVMLLKELIECQCKVVFLGGGNYLYKSYFGTIINEAYSGNIYSNRFYQLLNSWLKKKNIKTYAIYGVGKVGQSFLREAYKIKATLSYCIDQSKKEIPQIKTYTTDDLLPLVDAVFITINVRDKGVEDFLNSKFKHVYYWEEISVALYKYFLEN